MPGSGSCACDSIKYTYSGSPAATWICHCTDCQKWTGSAFTANLVVQTETLSVTGNPKVWTRVGRYSGMENRHFFCGDCGSSLFSQPGSMPGKTLIKAGTLARTNIPIYSEMFDFDRRSYINVVKGDLPDSHPV